MQFIPLSHVPIHKKHGMQPLHTGSKTGVGKATN